MTARKDECEKKFDWKMFSSIMIAIIGFWLRSEQRMTALETKVEGIQESVKIIKDNAKDIQENSKKLILHELRINMCEKVLGSNPDYQNNLADFRKQVCGECDG